MSAPLLHIEDLRIEIPLRKSTVHPLGGVSLQLEAGTTVGIVGESGCGKTMSALAIMNLLPSSGKVTSGKIHFDGHDLVGATAAQARKIRGTEIGMIFQDPLTSLNPTMRIGDQVGEPLRIHRGASRKEARTRAIEVMERVGMPRADRVVDDYPHQLSGGMRQRAMIAMALVCRPKLLIADEPTTALDVTTQKQILELIDDLRQEYRMGVMLITHDLGVVAGRTDRVVVMYGGQVVEAAPTDELFTNPRHQYTAALLDALPERALHTGQRLYSIPGTPPDLTNPPSGCRFAQRCRFASDQCRTHRPLMEGTDGHEFACFFPVDQQSAGLSISAAPTSSNTSTADTPEDETVAALLDVREISRNFSATSGTVIRHKVGTVSALKDVSFSLLPGQTYGLVGESGCGKSTIGRIVAGLDKPSEGAISLSGQNIAQLRGQEKKNLHRHVQMMFQDSYAAMDPRMRIDEILAEPLLIQQIGTRSDQALRIEELLTHVGLPHDVLSRYPHEFSGGQLQRIGFARALALKPQLIVADEPVSALDVSIQAQVLNLMKDLQKELGLTYLFISHDLSVVQYMSQRIGVMYLGTLVEEGPARRVIAHPAHPYTRALIDAVPVAIPGRLAKQSSTIQGELPSAINPPPGCRFASRCPLATELCQTTPDWTVVQSPQDDSTDGLAGLDSEHRVACHFPL
ncbi:MAG: ABC transporter ATP-binding protein [Actinomycetaceae bacterium]|nr:ABC transporter ATP-binding protein [Actinomycetaceae bacterium]